MKKLYYVFKDEYYYIIGKSYYNIDDQKNAFQFFKLAYEISNDKLFGSDDENIIYQIKNNSELAAIKINFLNVRIIKDLFKKLLQSNLSKFFFLDIILDIIFFSKIN